MKLVARQGDEGTRQARDRPETVPPEMVLPLDFMRERIRKRLFQRLEKPRNLPKAIQQICFAAGIGTQSCRLLVQWSLVPGPTTSLFNDSS